MKQLICEMCGSNDLVKDGGVFVCQSCGCKYSVEEAKKMMVEGVVEVTGTVKVDDSEEYERLIRSIKLKYDDGEYEDAAELCVKALSYGKNDSDLQLLRYLSIAFKEMPKIALGLTSVSAGNSMVEKAARKVFEAAREEHSDSQSSYADYSIKAFPLFKRPLAILNLANDMQPASHRVFSGVEATKYYVIARSLEGIHDVENLPNEYWLSIDDLLGHESIHAKVGYVAYKPEAIWHDDLFMYIDSRKKWCEANNETLPASITEHQKGIDSYPNELAAHRRRAGECQHCGGMFKGTFKKKCARCGKPKDY